MAKSKLVVNEVDFKSAVASVEANGPLANRSALFKAVAKEYNKTAQSQISDALVTLRIEEFGLMASLKTPKGKRGRPAGVKNKPAEVMTIVPATEAIQTPTSTEVTVTAPVVIETPVAVTIETPIQETITVDLPIGEGAQENIASIEAVAPELLVHAA